MDIIGGQHLRQMWDDLADVYGHKTALICESSGGVVNRYSYLELNQKLTARQTCFIRWGFAKATRLLYISTTARNLSFAGSGW